jgi:hypothetical protein
MCYGQIFEFPIKQVQQKLSLQEINLVLARLLNAAFAMTKWRYFDDQPAPIGTWGIVHKVISTAEDLAIMNTVVTLYDVSSSEISIAALLERGFMMETLQTSNFNRVQVQLTEGVLRKWATNPEIGKIYKKDAYQFYIALEADRRPERLRKLEENVDCRYWDTQHIVKLIEGCLEAVNAKKPLSEFGLDNIAATDDMVRLFKKLHAEWGLEGYKRQRRRESRKKHHKLLNVTYGLRSICHRLHAIQLIRSGVTSNQSISNNLKLTAYQKGDLAPQQSLITSAAAKENWWLVEESHGGLAVDLGKAMRDWVEAGVLIGFTTSDETDVFTLAVIKSVKKQLDGTYRVGLEVIARNAVSIRISCANEGPTSESLEGYFIDDAEASTTQLSTFSGLYIKAEGASAYHSLIMPYSEFKHEKSYRIDMRDEEQVILPSRIISRQHDWVRITMLT